MYVRHVIEAMLARPWWEATVFYEAFDMPGEDYLWGFALHDPAVAEGFLEKPVCDVMRTATEQQPALGGTGTDCSDGLDNEGDGKIDYPTDPDCKTASATSEGDPPPDAGPDGGAVDAAIEGGTGDTGGATAGDDASGCSCAVGERRGGNPLWVIALGALWSRRRGRDGSHLTRS
jgi:MYXO-CTERM domain-containing protein